MYMCIFKYIYIYIYNTHTYTWICLQMGRIRLYRWHLASSTLPWRKRRTMASWCTAGVGSTAVPPVSWPFWQRSVLAMRLERRHCLGLKNYLALSGLVPGTQRKIHGHFILNGNEVDQRGLEYPIFRTAWFIGHCDSSWTYLFTNQWRFSKSRWYLAAVKSGCNLWYTKYFPDPLFQHALNMSAYVYVYVRV